MGLEVTDDDVKELVDEYSEELATEDLNLDLILDGKTLI